MRVITSYTSIVSSSTYFDMTTVTPALYLLDPKTTRQLIYVFVLSPVYEVLSTLTPSPLYFPFYRYIIIPTAFSNFYRNKLPVAISRRLDLKG